MELTKKKRAEQQQREKDSQLFNFAHYKKAEEAEKPKGGYSYWASTFKAFMRGKTAMFFLALVILLLVFTYIQPFLPGQKNPGVIYNDSEGMQIRNAPPSREFLMGTNSIGQDLWSRVWAGARASLFIGFTVALIDSVLGTFIGVVWGYVRPLEGAITEIYNILNNVPTTLVLILVSYVLRPSALTIILALSLTGWFSTARFVRNQVIILRDRDYILASRCLGTPFSKIVIKNLLPYLVPVLTLRLALAIPSAISAEVFVSYIGLGLPVSEPSLGNLVTSGIDKMLEPSLRYQLLFPAGILALVSVAFYVVGNALADASDPKNHIY